MKTELEQDKLDKMRNNPENYKGTFLFNPQHKRFILRKNSMVGWTLNF